MSAMNLRALLASVVLSLAFPVWGCAQRIAPEADPVVILISIDGFGWNYWGRGPTPNLERLAREGVRSPLIPVFPTKTFPNHYTIVTGLYPAEHGIVSNTMYDPEMDAWFRLSDRDAVTDSRWWGGEPVWVTAERQGRVAAAYFWPGTETLIQGIGATHWKPYDDDAPHEDRVSQVLEWLDLPVGERPSMITLYFSWVDHMGHRYGPDAPEVDAGLMRVDSAIGWLVEGLERRGMLDRVNLLVASDHGMVATSPERVIVLDDYVDMDAVTVVDWSPVLHLRPRPGREAEVYEALAGKHPHLTVWRRDEIPERFRYRDHRRIQPIIALADIGWSIGTRARLESSPERFAGGNHGYDNMNPGMLTIFLARGPAFRRNHVAGPVSNIHLYELMAGILGLTPAPNSGSADSTRHLLR